MATLGKVENWCCLYNLDFGNFNTKLFIELECWALHTPYSSRLCFNFLIHTYTHIDKQNAAFKYRLTIRYSVDSIQVLKLWLQIIGQGILTINSYGLDKLIYEALVFMINLLT